MMYMRRRPQGSGSIDQPSASSARAVAPESGGAYAAHPTTASQQAVVEGGLGFVRHASTGNAFFVNAELPPSADYDVEGTIQVRGTLGTSAGTRENTWGVL